jgi:hypothetical protein
VWFGSGAGALSALGRQLGYTLVYAEMRGVNLFFVRDDLVPRLRQSAHLGHVRCVCVCVCVCLCVFVCVCVCRTRLVW